MLKGFQRNHTCRCSQPLISTSLVRPFVGPTETGVKDITSPTESDFSRFRIPRDPSNSALRLSASGDDLHRCDDPDLFESHLVRHLGLAQLVPAPCGGDLAHLAQRSEHEEDQVRLGSRLERERRNKTNRSDTGPLLFYLIFFSLSVSPSPSLCLGGLVGFGSSSDQFGVVERTCFFSA